MKLIITENQFKRLMGKIFKPKENIFVPHNLEGRGQEQINRIKRLLNKKVIDGDLDLRDIPITSLGNAEFINGDLVLFNNETLKSLGRVKEIKGSLGISYSSIEDLGDLERVEGGIFALEVFSRSKLKSLGKLQYVGQHLDIRRTNLKDFGNLKYVGGDLYLTQTKLSKKYSEKEIREKIEVKGRVVF